MARVITSCWRPGNGRLMVNPGAQPFRAQYDLGEKEKEDNEEGKNNQKEQELSSAA